MTSWLCKRRSGGKKACLHLVSVGTLAGIGAATVHTKTTPRWALSPTPRAGFRSWLPQPDAKILLRAILRHSPPNREALVRRRYIARLKMNFTPFPYLLLVALAGCPRATPPVKIDPSAQVVEVRQLAVTEDPAVRGDFPPGWRVETGMDLPNPPPEASEIPEFLEIFGTTQAPPVVEEELSPGATRTVQLQVAGPTGISGSARWIGTSSPLQVAIALDGSTLTTGTPYQVGTNRGGSYLQAKTTAGGLATVSVTNTSPVTAKVRIVFTAGP